MLKYSALIPFLTRCTISPANIQTNHPANEMSVLTRRVDPTLDFVKIPNISWDMDILKTTILTFLLALHQSNVRVWAAEDTPTMFVQMNGLQVTICLRMGQCLNWSHQLMGIVFLGTIYQWALVHSWSISINEQVLPVSWRATACELTGTACELIGNPMITCCLFVNGGESIYQLRLPVNRWYSTVS